VAKTEAGALAHDPVLVLQELDQLVKDVLFFRACPPEGDGCYSTHIGVRVREQCDQSFYHTRVLELGCVCVCVCLCVCVCVCVFVCVCVCVCVSM